MNLKTWKVESLDKDQAVEIAANYELPHVLAMLIQQRTKGDSELIENILYDMGLSESPFELMDMDKAVNRIKKAVDKFERIAIYGDYDADGITATSILYDYLQSLEADVMFYIPKREGEGYGMNKKAIEYLNSYEVKLIITVDNGIGSVEEVDFANSLGIDVVVTDHHRPSEVLPNAVAVVNPQRQDCPSLFKEYCGAGIALKLVLAMEFDFGDEDEVLERYADLASIGTIADIVSVKGENRTIIKKGIESMMNTERLGVKAVFEHANVLNLNSTSVAFSVVPRINATGRMGSPDRAVRLLTTNDEEEANLFAEDICGENERRREVELEIFKEAVMKIENNNELKYSRVLVVDGENWHAGVIGIVASRIMDRYGKPCIIISVSEGKGVGSGRSFGDFSLFNAIKNSSEHLIKFGGHHMAAGLSVSSNKIGKFRKAINNWAKENFEQMPRPEVFIDLKLQPTALSVDIPEQVEILEPFGKDNNAPVFGLYNMKIQTITAVGANKNHLRINFVRDGTAVNCMLFSCTRDKFPYKVGSFLDLAVSLSVNEYKGMRNLSVLIKAIKPSNMDVDFQIYAYNIYEKYIRGESLTSEEKELILPNRDNLAVIYKLIKASEVKIFNEIQILSSVGEKKFNLAKLILCLNALEECRLIEITKGEMLEIKILPTNKKVDIMNTNILRKLK